MKTQEVQIAPLDPIEGAGRDEFRSATGRARLHEVHGGHSEVQRLDALTVKALYDFVSYKTIRLTPSQRRSDASSRRFSPRTAAARREDMKARSILVAILLVSAAVPLDVAQSQQRSAGSQQPAPPPIPT